MVVVAADGWLAGSSPGVIMAADLFTTLPVGRRVADNTITPHPVAPAYLYYPPVTGGDSLVGPGCQ